MMKRNKRWITLLICIVTITSLLTTACSSSSATEGTTGGEITIGSKNFTENIILAYLMADMIENRTGIKVNRKVNLGGSSVAWTALQNNNIQLYPEYTGTIVANYYQQETTNSKETLASAKRLMKKDNLQFIAPFGFSNTYSLAVNQETAQKYNLKTFSDLAKVSPNLELASEFEFTDRADTYPGLKKKYNMIFKDVRGMDQGIKYRLIGQNDTDVVSVYSTDGQIKLNNLFVLKDDKHFFPPYDAGVAVRSETLKKYPAIKKALDALQGQINEQEMQIMNAKVDQGYREDDVAHEFLISKGLIK